MLPPNVKDEVDRNLELSKRYKNADNYQQAAFFMNKVAFIFWEAGDSKMAIKYFLETVPLNEKTGNYTDIKSTYSNIGLIYSDQNKLDLTLEYFEKSLVARRKLNNKQEVSAGLVDVAYIQVAIKQYEKAINNLNEAYKLAQEVKNPRLILNCLKLLAQCYDLTGNIAKAREYADQVAQYEQQLATQQLTTRFEDIVTQTETKVEQERQQRAQTEAEMALRALRAKFSQDSLNHIAQIQETGRLKAEEEAQYRQGQIDLLEKDKKLKETQILAQQAQQQRQLVILYASGGFLLLVSLFAIIVYRNFRSKKRANELLNRQNVEIEKQRNHIMEQNENINKSINYAQGIQKAILPPQAQLQKLIPESFIFFRPRDIVSGDYYWFKEMTTGINHDIKTGKIVITAVDCTGHGVPGAFLSMIGCNLLDEITYRGVDNAGAILRRLNNDMVRTLRQEETDNRDGMDMALCVVDTINKVVEFAGAKNPVIYVSNNDVQRIKGSKESIAGGTGMIASDYETHTIKIDSPTWFYLFSDGYIDQFGGKEGRKFMIKNFTELLASIAILPADQQRDMLKNQLKDWIGTKYQQLDDILIVGFLVEP